MVPLNATVTRNKLQVYYSFIANNVLIFSLLLTLYSYALVFLFKIKNKLTFKSVQITIIQWLLQ